MDALGPDAAIPFGHGDEQARYNEDGEVQTCTNSRLDELQKQKDAICGQRRTWDPDRQDACDRLGQFERCRDSRQRIQDEYFTAIDNPHIDALDQNQNGLDKCEELITKKCDPNHPDYNDPTGRGL